MLDALAPLAERGLLVKEEELGPLSPIGRGGTGIVYSTSIRDPQPIQGHRILAYKRYHDPENGALWANLSAIITSRIATEAHGAVLRDIAAWPERVVVDNRNSPIGMLMPIIPARFRQSIHLPSGREAIIAREAQHLMQRAEVARKNSIEVPSDDSNVSRIKICERLALALDNLHKAGMAYGDLSARNVLYSLTPDADIYLIDCDQVATIGLGESSLPLDSPDWEPPERINTKSEDSQRNLVASDLYKLGLFILRCLTPGRYSSVNRSTRAAMGALDPRGIALLDQALALNPIRRPSAESWLHYLREAAEPTGKEAPVHPEA